MSYYDKPGHGYQGMSSYSSAFEQSGQRRSRRSKLIVIGSIVALLALVGLGVGLGVGLTRNNDDSSDSSSSGDDPSVFATDDRLHKSFYGMAYTPEGSLLPYCGNNLEDVIKDIQLLSQLTTRIRLYGADCNQSALVLEAIERTNVDLDVYLGIYPIPTDNTAYTRQRDVIRETLETYGADHVAGITVGNEFMLNYVTGQGLTDANSAAAEPGAQILIGNIEDTRSMLSSLNLGKDIPIGNSDAGSFFNTKVLESVDYGLSNVHAWFANTSAQEAATWTMNFFEETNVQPASALSNQPKMYIAETGWPTRSSDEANADNGASDASEPNLQVFLDTFVCQANENDIPYFYFEFTDEEWKDLQFGGVEGWWGLFNKDRTLKDVTIPDCAPP